MRLRTILLACFLIATWSITPALAQAPDAGTVAASTGPQTTPASPETTPPGYLPVNGDMECAERAAAADPYWYGTVPGQWTGVAILKNLAAKPNMESALFAFGGMNCGSTASVEKMEGHDSWTFKAPDMEETTQPGKPFDVAMYQHVAVTPGKAYSLSAWMVSLCGGSATPNDCPPGYYIAKMLGIDPTGGTDPSAPAVIWVENRMPHIDAAGQKIGWQNLRVAARAQASLLTVFVRINSPFQHHGNHAFVDAVRLVEAPSAAFGDLPAQVSQRQFAVSWSGSLGPQIPYISTVPYALSLNVQYRLGAAGAWQDWLSAPGSGSAVFTVPPTTTNADYYFRILVEARQPDDRHDLWPYFPGVAAESAPVSLRLPPPGPPTAFIPLIRR